MADPRRLAQPLLLLLLLAAGPVAAQSLQHAAPPPVFPVSAVSAGTLSLAPAPATSFILPASVAFPGAAGETGDEMASLQSRAQDPWLGFDKVQHVAFSFLWTVGSQYTLVNKLSVSERQALPVSAGASAAVGLAKELYDRRAGPPHVFSRRDLVADAVGIALAVGFILL